MEFPTAWKLAALGAKLAVSDGSPEPPRDSLEWPRWRATNFVGEVVEKNAGELVVRLPTTAEGSPVFVLRDGLEASFAFPSPNLELTEALALADADRQAEDAHATLFSEARRESVDRLWSEIQRFHVQTATGTVPPAQAERRRQFPTLEALVTLSGRTIEATVADMEARLWDQVRESAVIDAQRILARDSIKTARSRAAKMAAANLKRAGKG